MTTAMKPVIITMKIAATSIAIIMAEMPPKPDIIATTITTTMEKMAQTSTIAATIMGMQPEMNMSTAITTTATTMSSMASIATITVSTATSMERMVLPITGIDTMTKRWVMATTVAATAPTRRGSSVPAWERRKTRSSRLWQQERGTSRMSSAQLAQAPAAVAAALPSQQLSRRHLPRLHRLQRQAMASEGGRA